jgi:hypothetical protein
VDRPPEEQGETDKLQQAHQHRPRVVSDGLADGAIANGNPASSDHPHQAPQEAGHAGGVRLLEGLLIDHLHRSRYGDCACEREEKADQDRQVA